MGRHTALKTLSLSFFASELPPLKAHAQAKKKSGSCIVRVFKCISAKESAFVTVEIREHVRAHVCHLKQRSLFIKDKRAPKCQRLMDMPRPLVPPL